MALNLLDPYERPARFYPAVIVVAPAICSVIIFASEAWDLLKGLGVVLSAVGAPYLLSQWAQHAGRRLQQEMEARDGRRSTCALRHREQRLSPQTKARYHTRLQVHGLHMPTQDEEAVDPVAADGMYAAACDWLREATRDRKNHPLIFSTLVAYGFRRNLVALRPTAVAVLAITILVNGFAIFHFAPEGGSQLWAGVVLEVGSIGLLIAWLLVLNRRFVDDASWAYTDRLLAALEHLPIQAQPKTTTRRPMKKQAQQPIS